MAAAGLICGLLFVFFCARRYKLDAENAAYIYTFGFLGCGVGAKLLYIAVTLDQIIADIKAIGFLPAVIAHTQGGLVFYGGLLGAIGAAFLTARFLKCDIKEYYPALVPGIAIMAGFGRIGCFLTGCCYGAHAGTHFGVVYPEGGIAPSGVPLIPVQLYEAVFEFLAVTVLVVISKCFPRVRPRLLALYCAAYAAFRFCLEFFRADEGRGIFGPFSTSQWISLILIAVIAVNEVLNKRRDSGKMPPAMV
ncbi:MAG: prolipoprotein diacylglyceryl transferase [Clostridiales bacterium]|nr:prolipoprotein diacylglyceryl transferase [Clostridiales bacterium]